MDLFFAGGIYTAVLFALAAFSAPSENRLITGVCFAVAGLIVGGLVAYLSTPTLAVDYGFYMVMAIIAAIVAVITSMACEKWLGGLIVGGFAVFYIIASIATTAPMFWSDDYQTLIGDIKTVEFTEDKAPIDIDKVRIVTNDELAIRLGDKRLGEIKGLGSQIDLYQANLQVLNGCFTVADPEGVREELCFEKDFIYVIPLEHSSVFKWASNDVTQGYVLVSATDLSKQWLVTGLIENGKQHNFALRYLNRGGYFEDNVERYLRQNGFKNIGLDDITFEINDQGHPYWVVTTYQKTVGMSGNEATGVVTVHAETGEIKADTTASAPAWIDRIQPTDFIVEQLNDNGQYIHGWLNSMFGQEDVTLTTEGERLVMGADGQLYVYTGISTAGSSQGTVGFTLVNTRTKEATFFKQAGATETAAQGAAESAKGVREAQYSAGNPILYNIGSVATYFTVLHGDDGLPKMYAFVNVEDYTIIGVGTSPRAALSSYRIALTRKGGINVDDVTALDTFEAQVAAITTENIGGTVMYYILLRGKDGKEYQVAPDLSVELKWTRVGDTVVVAVQNGDQITVNVVSFNNKDLDLIP